MDLTITILAMNGSMIFCYNFGTYFTAYIGISETFIGVTHINERGE